MQLKQAFASFFILCQSQLPPNKPHKMTSIPEDIVAQILLRLPPKSLMRFKAVNKSWRALICSPSFVYQHLDFFNATTTTNRHRLVALNDLIPNRPALSAVMLSDDGQVLDLESPPPYLGSKGPSLSWGGKYFYTSFCGPVNGIYCITIKQRGPYLGTFMLWNPATRQSHVLRPIPLLEDDIDFDGFYCGFGFDLSSNDYKVIGISNYGDMYTGDIDHFTSFHVYSLATNRWKELEPNPFEIDPDLTQIFREYYIRGAWDGFYFNGALHWLYRCYEDSDIEFTEFMMMISFNFGSHIFQRYSAPPITEDGKFETQITSVDGCLALVCSMKLESEPCIYDVYVMTEYGVQESWTKAYRVMLKSSLGDFLGIVDHEFFVREANDGPVVSYCLDSLELEQERHVYCYFNCSKFRILPYSESLVLVKPPDSKKKKQKRKKKMYKTWCGNEWIRPDTIVLVSASWKKQDAGIAWIARDRDTGEAIGSGCDRCDTTETAGQTAALAAVMALKWCLDNGRLRVVIWTDSFILWESLANNGMQTEMEMSEVISDILFYGKDLQCGRIKKVRHVDVVLAHRLAIDVRRGEDLYNHMHPGHIEVRMLRKNCHT